MFDDELEAFKTRIDLRQYAAAQGYQHDRKQSWGASCVMRHPASDDKIIVKIDSDGHYVYVSTRDDKGGSIIDFVKRQQNASLGTARKELRPWIGAPPVPVPSFPALRKTEKNRMNVELAFARMKDASTGHPYLEKERAIPAALLADDRFAGRIRIDARGNAVFPHFDQDGLTGYELKNVGFTGFSSGGTKSLWLSHETPSDVKIVFCESSIDALSHAVLFPDLARYASIGGKPSPQQPELMRAAIARMPVGAEIVAAMDADAGGRKLVEVVRRAFELTGRHDLRFTVHVPVGAKDWNDQLRAKPQPFLPYRPEAPSVA
jgi:hypothetical protein